MRQLPELIEDSSQNGVLASPIPIQALDTPALLVDRERLDRNLAGMQALAQRRGVRLRPHAKTHKSTILARLQLERGATGICTAKVSEAAVFAGAGVPELLVVYPLVGSKADGLAALGARHPGLTFEATSDSERGVEDLSRAATRHRILLEVWIKLDVGLHRAGVDPAGAELEHLAGRVASSPGLRLAGVVTHAGHVYRSRPGEGASIGMQEGTHAVEAARRLDRAGFGPLRVGVGSTPTALAAAAVEGVTEIHPGVYVFGDRQQAALGGMLRDEGALTVLATVVSHPVPGRWIVDAGSKTLSSDRGAHGSDTLRGYGSLRRLEAHVPVPAGAPMPFSEAIDPDPDPPATPQLNRLSEEHGVIEDDRDLLLGPGDRVEIVPNHACAAVNLALRLYVTEGAGVDRKAVAVWPVDARACVA